MNMATGPLHFQLQLQRAGDPIEGHLTDEHGETVSFMGWLELIAAIEAAKARGADGTPHHVEPRT